MQNKKAYNTSMTLLDLNREIWQIYVNSLVSFNRILLSKVNIFFCCYKPHVDFVSKTGLMSQPAQEDILIMLKHIKKSLTIYGNR